MTLLQNDTMLQSSITHARVRSLAWFTAMQADHAPRGIVRISPAHDQAAWPGMLLPGTYNALMCLKLLGATSEFGMSESQALIAWLEDFRRRDGVFRISGMADGEVFKKPDIAETWRYIDFHVTNYSLGAIEALDDTRRPYLDFVSPWLAPCWLEAWLSRRDLRDPWQEGNNIVNLGSFLLLTQKFGGAGEREKAAASLQILFDWHDRLQEPATGFWGIGQFSSALQMLHAMAGSMHNFHLWYATGRPLSYQDKAADYALSRTPSVHSACIDVDLVDLLVHAHRLIDHRRQETEAWLRALLPALLAIQNEDGGFPDMTTGEWRQDGWVGGYKELQGLSNTFATYFRWIAIAMIADCLWPGWRRWHFRQMIGIGYRMEMTR